MIVLLPQKKTSFIKPARINSPLKKLCGLLGIAIILCLLAAIAARYIRPNANDLLPLFGLLFPYIYIAALGIVPCSYYANKWIGIMGTVVLLSATPHIFSYVQPWEKHNNHKSNLTVMTYNAMMGYDMVNKHHMFDKQSQADLDHLLLQVPAPDIICGQEASNLVRAAFAQTFQGYHKHQLADRGAIILSKYPIVDKGQVDFGSEWNSCVWADIALSSEQRIRVYSIHFESNRLDISSSAMLTNQEYDKSRALKGFWSLLKRYPEFSAKRGDQADLVKDHMNHCPYPIIVAGDFNEPPMSYIYSKIKEGLVDTFIESGDGWGTTWRGAVPMLRIDYIFSSAELNNKGFDCLQSDLSDHYPIKASFDIH